MLASRSASDGNSSDDRGSRRKSSSVECHLEADVTIPLPCSTTTMTTVIASNTTPHVISHGSESDLFSFLSAMHLSGGGSFQTNSVTLPQQQQQQQVQSRKRKIFEPHGHGESSSFGPGKLNGVRPPALRRNSCSNGDDDQALQTPQCSNSGYTDDEDQTNACPDGVIQDSDSVQTRVVIHNDSLVAHTGKVRQLLPVCPVTTRHHSPSGASDENGVQQQPLMREIDENLAADFDGSFSGLGVDADANYSMSEALMALPNLSISSSQFLKQEVDVSLGLASNSQNDATTTTTVKDERLSVSPITLDAGLPSAAKKSSIPSQGCVNRPHTAATKKSLEAPDLSNEEAHLPETTDNALKEEKSGTAPKTFTGSVSSKHGLPPPQPQPQPQTSLSASHECVVNLSGSHPNLSLAVSAVPSLDSGDDVGRCQSVKMHKVVLASKSRESSKVRKRVSDQSIRQRVEPCGGKNADGFQYILAAATSNATKINEPSITYLNQGQAYELSLKKLGNSSCCEGNEKSFFLCKVRICFHERRLQYMQAVQIAEWSAKHPGERILDLDLPLSYGIVDPHLTQQLDRPGTLSNINVLTFRWDPTRETAAFIKVNCISTEFTPRKHGGERGVPFRLQVEIYATDTADNSLERLDSASCILQVFKLKGADRKNRQDREKISKRSPTEQEKFAPSYNCTILTDLGEDEAYQDASHDASSVQGSSGMSMVGFPSPSTRSPVNPLSDTCAGSDNASTGSNKEVMSAGYCGDRGKRDGCLKSDATPEEVQAWLTRRRYDRFVRHFRKFDGVDMLRLVRDEVIAICGLSEGIRLYNDLRVKPSAPSIIVYVASKDSKEYHALYLEEQTLVEFWIHFAQSLGVPPRIFNRIFFVGPNGILVTATDNFVRHIQSESLFHFTLRASVVNVDDGGSLQSSDIKQNSTNGKCDVIFEEVIHSHLSTNTNQVQSECQGLKTPEENTDDFNLSIPLIESVLLNTTPNQESERNERQVSAAWDNNASPPCASVVSNRNSI